jgi:hypothetical protein
VKEAGERGREHRAREAEGGRHVLAVGLSDRCRMLGEQASHVSSLSPVAKTLLPGWRHIHVKDPNLCAETAYAFQNTDVTGMFMPQ